MALEPWVYDMATRVKPAPANSAEKVPPPINRIAPVVADATSVPADGVSVVYLLNLCMGSYVTIDGPECDAFVVTDETIGLAFGTAGEYSVTVGTPGQAPVRLKIRALSSADHSTVAYRDMPGKPGAIRSQAERKQAP